MKPGLSGILRAGTCLLAGLFAVPALAQDSIDPELDRLITAGQSPAAAIAEADRQEAAGDMLGAASTLERALIDQPSADDVRLAYAAVLCKLDDKASARTELAALRGRRTSSSAWQRMEAACGSELAGAARHTSTISGTISAGAAYDSNAADTLLPFGSFGLTSRDGLAFVASLELDAKVPMGNGFAYAGAFALTHNDQSGPTNDYQYGELTAGYGMEGESHEVSGGAVIRHGRIDGANYFTAYGGQARLALRSGQSGQFVITGEVTHENYVFNLSDGTRYDLLAGYDYTAASQARYFIALGGEIKNARYDPFSYKAVRLVGSARFPLGGNGAYLSTSATMRYLDYDYSMLPFDHKELRLFAQAAVGIPIAGPNLLVEPAVNFRWRDNNAASFLDDYSSFGAELRLVYRF